MRKVQQYVLSRAFVNLKRFLISILSSSHVVAPHRFEFIHDLKSALKYMKLSGDVLFNATALHFVFWNLFFEVVI